MLNWKPFSSTSHPRWVKDDFNLLKLEKVINIHLNDPFKQNNVEKRIFFNSLLKNK